MAIQLQLRRGTTVENDAFTGAAGELTMDTTTNGLRIHDGTQAGGYEIDTVVEFQKPTAQNNYTWARKYASGWVEQGGVTGSGVGSVTFPVTMADDNYTIVRVQNFTSGTQSNYPGWTSGVSTKTTTGFTFNNTADSSCWEVKGVAA